MGTSVCGECVKSALSHYVVGTFGTLEKKNPSNWLHSTQGVL